MLEPEDNTLDYLASRLTARLPSLSEYMHCSGSYFRFDGCDGYAVLEIDWCGTSVGYTLSMSAAPICLLPDELSRTDLLPRLVDLITAVADKSISVSGREPFLQALPRKSAWLHLPTTAGHQDFDDDSGFTGSFDDYYPDTDAEFDHGFERS